MSQMSSTFWGPLDGGGGGLTRMVDSKIFGRGGSGWLPLGWSLSISSCTWVRWGFPGFGASAPAAFRMTSRTMSRVTFPS